MKHPSHTFVICWLFLAQQASALDVAALQATLANARRSAGSRS